MSEEGDEVLGTIADIYFIFYDRASLDCGRKGQPEGVLIRGVPVGAKSEAKQTSHLSGQNHDL